MGISQKGGGDGGENFELDLVLSNVRKIVEKYGSQYWAEHDEARTYPLEFVGELEKLGVMGVNIPEEFGGMGMGLVAATSILSTISGGPGGATGSNTVHASFFNNFLLAKYGTDEVKKKYLPQIARGEKRSQVFAITEPHSGFNTSKISTQAVRDGDKYILNGRKTFISRVRHSNMGVFAARTTPYEKVEKKGQGISMFVVDIDDNKNNIEIGEIPNNARRCIDTNNVFLENVEVPASNLLGEEGKGIYYLLEEANAERILIAGQNISGGKYVLQKAADYAKNRKIFDDPIAKYQGIQYPLADAWIKLAAAESMMDKALNLIESDAERRTIGLHANMAKYLSAEAYKLACDKATEAMGGSGFSVELDVERHWRNAELGMVAPVSQNMVLNFVSQRALGLPRSY